MWLTKQKQHSQSTTHGGFTIIELLVVIVVIGILAAITIVAFNGIRQRANLAVLQSDISGASKTLALANADNGTYPAALASAGLKASPNTTYQYTYTSSDNTYCLTATNSGVAYTISTSNQTPTAGVCTGHTAPVAGGGSSVNSSVVTTLAGSTQGYMDGTGSSAQFSLPSDVAVDGSGTVYIADLANHRIRKITSAGVVTTLAGSGTAGYADGTGTSAQFYNPNGVAVDSSGTVYVADRDNMRIRKITSAGVVTTFAGSGMQGFADGNGASAQFNIPIDLAVDSSGTVYVADYSNHRIRKITSAGVVTTFAGSGTQGYADGTGSSAQFSLPAGVAVDSSGTVYVADRGNNRIRKITSAGVVSTLAGSGTYGYADGTGSSAQFNTVYGVAVDSSGAVYVPDMGNNRIRKITSAGVVSTLAGSGTRSFADGTGSSAQFNYPYSVAVDASGTVYVADQGNNRIRKIQ